MSSIETELRPTSANWALIEEAQDGKPQQEQALRWCRDRLQFYSEMHDDNRSYVVLTQSGHWGRGKDLLTAATNAAAAGARRTVKALMVLVLGDPLPQVNQYGAIIASSQSCIVKIGMVRTLGSLLG